MDDVSYSISSGKSKQFGLVDFIVFGITLIVSLFIGIFYAYKDRNIKDPSEFLIGGGNMGIFPVSLSLTVTFLSALTLLGMPAEIYNFNTMFWWLALGMVLAVAGAAHIFNPVFFRMGITSVYEYLEMRFGKMMGVLASLNWMIATLFYLAFVLYAPSLALKSVTGMDLWVSILTVGGLVTFYTSIGGMKTVLWTDSYQAVLILIGLLAVFIQGCIVVGGFPHAWDIATNKSRIMFNDFDPGTRHSFWSVVIGGGVMWMSFYAVNQSQVQRLLTLSTVRRVQIALWISAASLVIIVSLCCMIGVVLFAFYSNCHPVHHNLISTADELLPLFVMDILSHLKGLPGVFLTCIFSGSLSSLSSGINSMSAVILQDYIRAFSPWEVSDFHATIITKVTAAVFGLLTIGMAFLASKLGSILQVSYKGISSFDGPLFGVFILGLFFPRTNTSGTTIGYFISLTFMLWISIGSFLYAPPAQEADYSMEGCNGTLQTTAPIKENATFVEADGFLIIYRLSYLYYTMTGTVITIVTGYIASCITGYGKQVDVDPKLLHPIVRRFNRGRNRVEEKIDLTLDKSETVGLHRNPMDQSTKRKNIYEVKEETL